jgi:hypothetical protein
VSTATRVHAWNRLIIFDLDGVITGEEADWDCGGLTLHELLYNPSYGDLSADIPYRPATTTIECRW